MINKIPGDPRCADCAQGKQVKKGKYTIYKEDIVNMKEDLKAVEQRAPAPLVEKAKTEPAAQKKGPGRPPKKRGRPLKETLSPLDLKKTCSVCGKAYPATREHFRGHNATPDGLENRCKSCIGKTNILELDFSGRTNLLDKLTEMAAAEYRTPELQLMAMIAKEV